MASNTADVRADVAIVGGGLAGLTAATYLARAGRVVVLYERSSALGGRARTQDHDGFLFNLGPHALYRGGAAMPILRELGVEWRGAIPRLSGSLLANGRRQPLPTGLRGFLATTILPWGAKAELLALVPRLLRLDCAPLDAMPLREWLAREVRHDALRRLLESLVRVTSYSADPERASAGAALAQLRLGLTKNVEYLDGGWQTLVAGLRCAAQGAGVRIVTDARVEAVLRAPGTGAACGVRLADGTTRSAATVLLATESQATRALLADSSPLTTAAIDRAVPLRMACLDVALSALPDPATSAIFGLDRPLYLVAHSATARLAPRDGAIIHVGKYYSADRAADPADDLHELEGLLDLAQPGWRDRIVTRRFLPQMRVSGALVTASAGGLAGRPDPAVPEVPGLFLAGDWVGPEGMLATAALASARSAATHILAALLQPA